MLYCSQSHISNEVFTIVFAGFVDLYIITHSITYSRSLGVTAKCVLFFASHDPYVDLKADLVSSCIMQSSMYPIIYNFCESHCVIFSLLTVASLSGSWYLQNLIFRL